MHVAGFIADFLAPSIHLIAEGDGPIHARKRGPDERRALIFTAALPQREYSLLGATDAPRAPTGASASQRRDTRGSSGEGGIVMPPPSSARPCGPARFLPPPYVVLARA